MTQFNATITERINVFGVGPSSKWNEYNWNAFKWGEGTNQIPTRIFANVAVIATITPSAPLGLGLAVAEAEALTGGSTVVPAAFVSESQSPTAGIEHVNKLDETGDYYVFPDRTLDGEASSSATWTRGSATAPTWTSGTVSAISWS